MASKSEGGGPQWADGPVPLSEFRAVGWRDRVYWIRPHERLAVRCLFLAAACGRPVRAAELPRSLRQDSDAWGELIVEEPGGWARLADPPATA